MVRRRHRRRVDRGEAATETTATTETTERPTPTDTTESAAAETSAVKEAPPKAVFIGETPLGVALTDADGSRSTASRTTATATQPATTPAPTRGHRCWSTATHCPTGSTQPCSASSTATTGTHQLKAGKWPLYRFAGDDEPGQTNGQGSGDVWFVVNPDGSLKKG